LLYYSIDYWKIVSKALSLLRARRYRVPEIVGEDEEVVTGGGS
jgi:hypothetical protein